MLSNFFTSFGWTRDDTKWTVGIVCALIVGLATALVDDKTAAYYGFPVQWLPRLRGLSLIVGILSAAMKTSGLPGKQLVALIGILLTGGAFTGCAATRHPNLSPVGQQVSYARDALIIAENTSATLKGLVDAGSLTLTPTIAAQLRALGDVGAVCSDIGVLFDAYLQAVDEVSKLKATADLKLKIVELQRFVTNLPRDAITAAADDLVDKVKQLKTQFGIQE